ncbi:antibiotic biosynthesis monooxygenase family protein [Nocardia sp. GCM10030253]|uniref:antibiotic biosynthesis monooxygenase family protein n=1 Tax=Nocardia sp. GCM10030253 TaxID=3273404 RepID=UPI00362C0E5B
MTDNGITFINVFEIPADQIEEFVDNWHERARLMRAAPGFRDVRLHRAILPDTRFQLVNVAHWDSAEACEAAGANPAVVSSVDAARKVASANPALYEVVAEYL